MVVPYGDSSPSHNRQNAFDVGEYGVGWLANALELGCDCLGNIHYFDAHMTDNDGNLLTLPNAICMHEEDYGILWKHTNFRTGHMEVRRSRRLVVSFIATVGIYEYGFFWYFYQDGSLQLEIKLTGIMNIGAVMPGETPKYGKLVAPQLYAPIHQHFFCFRLEPMIDGLQNSVVEEHTESVPLGPENPFGNAFYVQSTVLKTELEAQQTVDLASARTWKVINPNVLNPLTSEPVGYQLMAGNNVLPFAHPSSSFLQRAAFASKHLWATPLHAEERFPAGDYPNQHPGSAGLPTWTQQNRSIENREVVLWHTVGVHHAPRIEDWPVMPVAYAVRATAFYRRTVMQWGSSAIAALALVLAALGLYGMLAYSVAQRTRELGVRIALGAQRGDLLFMVVSNGLKLALMGIALGVGGGLLVARMIASLLYGVTPRDLPTFVGVGVALFAVALAASYIPALRATRVDPMVALRYE